MGFIQSVCPFYDFVTLPLPSNEIFYLYVKIGGTGNRRSPVSANVVDSSSFDSEYSKFPEGQGKTLRMELFQISAISS